MHTSTRAEVKWPRLRYSQNLIVSFLVMVFGASITNAATTDLDRQIIQSIQQQDMLIKIPEPEPARFVYLNEKDSVWNFKNLEKEVYCLAQNIYFESKLEPEVGQVAVGLVTINRVRSIRYPNSICGVVWQQTKHRKTKRLTAQFSWTLDGRPDVPRDMTLFEQCLELARSMLRGGSLDNFEDFTQGATHYHATYVKPKWRKQMKKVAQYGLHVFYQDPKLMVALD